MQPSCASEPVSTKQDRRDVPPERTEFFSPDKKLVFVVSSSDSWNTNKALGELFVIDGKNRKLLWSRSLAQRYGPRFALLNNAGTTLLLDEWINVKSDFAVMILSRDNKELARHTFEAVRNVLDVSLEKVIKLSKHGWWISAPPKLGAEGKTAAVQAAGKILVIDLSDGNMFLAKE
jgi:hypothetical protein